MWKFEGDYITKTHYSNKQVSTKFFLTVPNTFNPQSPAPSTQSKISTVLTLNPLPPTIKVGETLTFSGSLMTTDGMPVADKKIYLRDGVNELGSLDTRQDGTFAGTMKMNQAGNDYRVFAFFYGGSSNFETAQSQLQSFEVRPASFQPPSPTQPDDNPYAGILGLVVLIIVIVGIVIGIKGARKKRPTQYQTTGGSGQQQMYQPVPPKKRKFTRFRKPKPKVQPQGIEDYDLGPLLYCPNVACRSEHLQTKANGQKYCTKCGWNK
jgi:hypothetical protein